MPVREEVKSLLGKELYTLTELANLMTEKTGQKYTLQSLSQKLRRGTLSFNEVEIIAKILGYKINFDKIGDIT